MVAATCFPRSFSRGEHGTTIVRGNGSDTGWACRPGRPRSTRQARRPDDGSGNDLFGTFLPPVGRLASIRATRSRRAIPDRLGPCPMVLW
jgi:hypothetical protein